MSDNIHVAIRVRPLIEREIKDGSPVSWLVQGSNQISQVDKKGNPVHGTAFVFDSVFPTSSTNREVYQQMCHSIVKSVAYGFHGTIFAYGQTSSGKTFTMMGQPHDPGLIMLAVQDIFKIHNQISDREFLFRVSYMEIYNEKILDLLSNRSNLLIKENLEGQVFVGDLEEVPVTSIEDVLNVMTKGERSRHFGDTAMNEHSSRSHTIFKMVVESRHRDAGDDSPVKVAHLNLVDLAGSEKAGQMGTTGSRFKEGVHINKSLLTLSQVISKLSEGAFVNYRDSKLTRILQNSLGGNSLTAIICTVTPTSIEQTQSTLSFAVRAKRVQNKPVVNEVLSEAAQIRKHQQQIAALQEQVRQKETQIAELKKNGPASNSEVISNDSQNKRSIRRETWGGDIGGSKVSRLKTPRESTMSTETLGSILEVEEVSPPRSSLKRRSEEHPANVWDQNPELCPNVTTRRKKNTSSYLENEVSMGEIFQEQFSIVELKSPSLVKCSPMRNQLMKDVVTLRDKNNQLEETLRCLQDEYAELREFTIIEREVNEDGTYLGEAISFSILNPSQDVSIVKYSFGCQTEAFDEESVCDNHQETLEALNPQKRDAETCSNSFWTRNVCHVFTQTEIVSKSEIQTQIKETDLEKRLYTSCTQTIQETRNVCDFSPQTENGLLDIDDCKSTETCTNLLGSSEFVSKTQSTQTELEVLEVESEKHSEETVVNCDTIGVQAVVLNSDVSSQTTQVSYPRVHAFIQTVDNSLRDSFIQTDCVSPQSVSCQTSHSPLPTTSVSIQTENSTFTDKLVQTDDTTSPESSESQQPGVSVVTQTENATISVHAFAQTENKETTQAHCQTALTVLEDISTQTSVMFYSDVFCQADLLVTDTKSFSMQTDESVSRELQECSKGNEVVKHDRSCQTDNSMSPTVGDQKKSALSVEELEEEILHWKEQCAGYEKWSEDHDKETKSLKEKLEKEVSELQAVLERKAQECSSLKNDLINFQSQTKALNAQTKELQDSLLHYQTKVQQLTDKLRRAENQKMDNTLMFLRKREPETALLSTEDKTKSDPYSYEGAGVAGRIRILALEKENARIKREYNKLLHSYRSSQSSSSSIDKSSDLKENVSSSEARGQKTSSASDKSEVEAVVQKHEAATPASLQPQNNLLSSKIGECLRQHENKMQPITICAPKVKASASISPPARTHLPLDNDFALEMDKIMKGKGSKKLLPDSPDGCKQQ